MTFEFHTKLPTLYHTTHAVFVLIKFALNRSAIHMHVTSTPKTHSITSMQQIHLFSLQGMQVPCTCLRVHPYWVLIDEKVWQLLSRPTKIWFFILLHERSCPNVAFNRHTCMLQESSSHVLSVYICLIWDQQIALPPSALKLRIWYHQMHCIFEAKPCIFLVGGINAQGDMAIWHPHGPSSLIIWWVVVSQFKK